MLQNGRDAEVEHQAPLTVEWRDDTLYIENVGVTIPLKAMLLGHTTKVGNSAMIGQHGEGLDTGLLALVRAGHEVKIRNGSEVWTPTLEHNPQFDEEVLTLNVQGGNKPKNRVRIEIGGITKDAWGQMRDCFLFLSKPTVSDRVDTHYGALLLNPKMAGRIYVKGIFVQTDADLRFGYDIKDVELDRDRRMVESWNLKYHTKNIMLLALAKREDLFPQFETMLHDPTTEVDSIQDAYSVGNMPDAVMDFVVARFVGRHGVDAVPVQTLSESKDIEHLGKRGIVVSKQLGAVLAKKLGDSLTVKMRLAKEETARYGWSDLSTEERTTLEDAVALINVVESLTLDVIEIVDFRDPRMMGQFKGATGQILLARKHLQDPAETLATLVHETAHRGGGDGEVDHVRRIEHIWAQIVQNLRSR